MTKRNKTMTVLLASGASGGHLFPALAVAEVLRDRGVRCVFVVGGNRFGEKVTEAGFELVCLPAGAFNVRNPFRKMLAVMKLVRALLVALRLVLREKPAVVLGTGGYASVATVLAAKAVGVPTMAHEQNVLPGRANRFLARVVDKLLLSFEESRAYVACSGGCEVVGMPLRKAVVATAGSVGVPPALEDGGLFGILMLGGSKGSKLMSDVVAEMIAAMTPEERAAVRLVHQARVEDVDRLRVFYAPLGLGVVDVRAFFDDLPEQYRKTHLVIGRSGTGTMVETAVMGRAAIYSPHQLADNHQKLNADVMEQAGGAIVLDAPVFTSANLLVQVRKLWQDPAKRKAMEEAARQVMKPGAAERVAELVLRAASEDILQDVGTK